MQTSLWNEEESNRMKEQYNKEGFVFIPDFLKDTDLDQVLKVLQELTRDKISEIPNDKVYYEEKGEPDSLKQIQQLFNYHPLFYSMMFQSQFTALAALLLGENAIGKNMQYFNKPPGISKPTPPHQDGFYFMLNPPVALTMWLSLDHVDEQNGCVRYVKGSHLLGMRPHGRTNILGFSQGILDFGKESDFVHEAHFKTKPGDLLVHHALTVHWAERNSTVDRTRKSLGFIYYGKSAKEDQKAHKAYQVQLAKELKDKNVI